MIQPLLRVLPLALLTGTALAQNPPAVFQDASTQLAGFTRAGTGGGGLSGLAWLDFDGDLDLDLVVAGARGQAPVLYRNDGPAGFSLRSAAQSGLAHTTGSCAVLAADFDNDGDPDLIFTGDFGIFSSGTPSPCAVYQNPGGGAPFTNITALAGVTPPNSTMAAVAADIDGDSDLDLFIAAPGDLLMGSFHLNRLYLNTSSGGAITFQDVTATLGAPLNTFTPPPPATGGPFSRGSCVALFHDFARTGFPDLLIGNCNLFNGPGAFIPAHNEFFLNTGAGMVDVSSIAGFQLPMGALDGFWMGLEPLDYDGDGDMDIHMSNIPNAHALMRNDKLGFADVAGTVGTQAYPFGWGNAASDYDNDADADLFFVGTLELPFPPQTFIGAGSAGNPGTLFINEFNTAGVFRDNAFYASNPIPNVGLELTRTSGVAAGDYDGDGWVDLAIATESYQGVGGAPVLLRNVSAQNGNTNNSVRLRLVGQPGAPNGGSNTQGVGAMVHVIADGRHATQLITAGAGFASTHSKWPTFGLGAQTQTQSLWVEWPSGRQERFPDVASGSFTALTEGTGVSMTANTAWVSESVGATVTFNLDAGAAAGGQAYWVYGTFSGTSPGTPFQGSVVALNVDGYTNWLIGAGNGSPFHTNVVGTLNGAGQAVATTLTPPGTLGLAGSSAHHLFLTFDATTSTFNWSNPVETRFIP